MAKLQPQISMMRFVQGNRDLPQKYVASLCTNCQSLTDVELRKWVLNDEYLYRWAVREGVQP